MDLFAVRKIFRIHYTTIALISVIVVVFLTLYNFHVATLFDAETASPLDMTHALTILETDSIYKGQRQCIECAPIVIEQHKLLFFTSAKVGCTVWKQLFRRIIGMDDWQAITEGSANIPHHPNYNGLKYLYHYTLEEATLFLTSPQWTRAIFVRDPKERLLSAYLDKAVPNHGSFIKKMCCDTHNRTCKQRVRKAVETFAGFIHLTRWCTDPHWTLQKNRMELQYWPYMTFVGHLESAATDAETLLRHVGAWEDYGASGWGANGQDQMFGVNLSPHVTGSKHRLKEYYTPELETLVDFELFASDYDFAPLQLMRHAIDWSTTKEPNVVINSSVTHELQAEIWSNITRARSTSSIMADSDPLYKGALQCWDCSPIVIESHKLLFFTVPKVGCTVFKQLFRRMMGHDDYTKEVPGGLPHDPATNGLVYLHQYSSEQAQHMMTSPDWTRAIFVRDPKERFLSAYLDKGVRSSGKFLKEKCCQRDDAPDDCQRDIEVQVKSLKGFTKFARWCPNPHWAPQSSRIGDPYWTYITFVGHLETAANDSKELLIRLGLWEKYGSSGWGQNGSDSIFTSQQAQHVTGASVKFRMHYTPELEINIEHLYASDYAHPVLNLTRKTIRSS